MSQLLSPSSLPSIFSPTSFTSSSSLSPPFSPNSDSDSSLWNVSVSLTSSSSPVSSSSSLIGPWFYNDENDLGQKALKEEEEEDGGEKEKERTWIGWVSNSLPSFQVTSSSSSSFHSPDFCIISSNLDVSPTSTASTSIPTTSSTLITTFIPSSLSITTMHTNYPDFFSPFPSLPSHYFDTFLLSSVSTASCSEKESPSSSPRFCECPSFSFLPKSYLLVSFAPSFSSFRPLTCSLSGSSSFHSAFSLLTLPLDVFLYLCNTYLTSQDMAKLSQVCRLLRIWTYHPQLRPFFKSKRHPFALSSFQLVREIDFKDDALKCETCSLQSFESVPSSICYLTLPNLVHLSLPSFSFTSFPSFGTSLIHLMALHVPDTLFSDHGLHVLAHVAPCLMDLNVSFTRVTDRGVHLFLKSRRVPMVQFKSSGCVGIEGTGVLDFPIHSLDLSLTSVSSWIVKRLIQSHLVQYLDVRCTPWIDELEMKELKELAIEHHVNLKI